MVRVSEALHEGHAIWSSDRSFIYGCRVSYSEASMPIEFPRVIAIHETQTTSGVGVSRADATASDVTDSQRIIVHTTMPIQRSKMGCTVARKRVIPNSRTI